MRTGLGAVVVALAAAAGGPAGDKDTPVDARKLVGKWEPKEPKKGEKVQIEFTKDGKLAITSAVEGKTEKYEGTYAVSGNKLSITMKIKDADVKDTVTVLRLTDDEMDTVDGKGKKDFLRRVPGG